MKPTAYALRACRRPVSEGTWKRLRASLSAAKLDENSPSSSSSMCTWSRGSRLCQRTDWPLVARSTTASELDDRKPTATRRPSLDTATPRGSGARGSRQRIFRSATSTATSWWSATLVTSSVLPSGVRARPWGSAISSERATASPLPVASPGSTCTTRSALRSATKTLPAPSWMTSPRPRCSGRPATGLPSRSQRTSWPALRSATSRP